MGGLYRPDVSSHLRTGAGFLRDDEASIFWAEASGGYLLTSANTDAMIQSLRHNLRDLRVMNEADIERLERWHGLCARYPAFCVVYSVDY